MIAIINYLLTVSIAAAGASGFINGMGEGFGVPDFSGILLPVAALALILGRAVVKPSGKIGAHWFFWPIALAVAARTLFPASIGDLRTAYDAVLIVTVLFPAIMRTEPVWIAAFLFSGVSYTVQKAVELKESWMGLSPAEIGFALVIKLFETLAADGLLEFWGILLVVGIIPWGVLKKRSEAQDRELNRTLEEVRSNAITDAMARTRALSQEASKKGGAKDHTATGAISGVATGVVTSSMSAHTLKMDAMSPTDTISMRSGGVGGGSGDNAQLKSVLHFMFKNFKALTAGLFTYDQSKRTLTLDCYETKSGVRVKEGAQIPFGAGVIGQTAASKTFFMSGDLSSYNFNEHSYYVQNEGISSILAAPIVLDHAGSNKELLGVLVIDSPNKSAFTDRDMENMVRFSAIAAALLDNMRMNFLLAQSITSLNTLNQVGHEFTIALNVDDIFAAIAKFVPQLVPSCTRQVFIMHEQEQNMLKLRLIAGAKAELGEAEGWEFPPESGGIYSYAFNMKTKVPIPDYQTQKSYRFVPEEPSSPVTRTLLVVPIIGGEDHRCLGLYSIETSAPDAIKGETEKNLTTIIENASVALTRSLLFLKMKEFATTDGLTGLNNHRTFQDTLTKEYERMKRSPHSLSLLLTDIDHFKSFNDKYGHPVGDLVLREIAQCIKTAVRLTDFPARYGGEEFAVILPETDERGALVIAERIRLAVEAKVVISGSDHLRVTISIGCATFPAYGQTKEELIDCADKALYASKKGGRNRVSLYNPTMTMTK